MAEEEQHTAEKGRSYDLDQELAAARTDEGGTDKSDPSPNPKPVTAIHRADGHSRSSRGITGGGTDPATPQSTAPSTAGRPP